MMRVDKAYLGLQIHGHVIDTPFSSNPVQVVSLLFFTTQVGTRQITYN